MTVRHAQFTVTSTPQSITTGVVDSSNASGIDKSIIIQNSSVFVVYVGGLGVTTSNYGYKIPANGELAMDLLARDVVYVVSSESATISVLYLGM